MNHTDIKALMSGHVMLQQGTYFSRVEELGCASFAFSDTIDDFFWNYAYGIDCSFKTLPDCLARVRQQAASINRPAVIYGSPDVQPSGLVDLVAGNLLGEEVWMTLQPAELHIKALPQNFRVVHVVSQQEMDDFITTFEDAYGTDEGVSSGYSGLSPEYAKALQRASPLADVTIVHFVGYLNDEPASIATVHFSASFAGLYNVGTRHSARRRGLASVMSQVALEHAFASGCSSVFLQTEPDSAVEQMYNLLGFKRQFTGAFVQLP